MSNRLVINEHDYDLDKIIQLRGSFPEVKIERHLVVDPRVLSNLKIEYFPEIHPAHPAYQGKIVFYEHDRLCYALIGREALYRYLDDMDVSHIPGFKIPKMALKKLRLTQFRHEGQSDEPVRVENSWRYGSDRRESLGRPPSLEKGNTQQTLVTKLTKHTRPGKY